MKHLNKLFYLAAASATLLFAGACTEETKFIYPEPEITRFTVSPLSVDMNFAEELTFTVAVRPGNTEYTWESTDPNIAYVDENDRIVPVGVGEVELTCKAGEFSQTITAMIHPSVVVSKDYLYVKAGETPALDFVQILPENATYTVTTDNDAVVAVPDASKLGIQAKASGVANIKVAVADGENTVDGAFTVAVVGSENVVNASAAAEYFYDATTLGHPVYGVTALALTPSGVTYADGGVWSGAGKAVFLKLYNPERGSAYAAVPAGTYTAGESTENFFAEDSYIIDVESGDKTGITAGEIVISDNGVTGFFTAGSEIYTLNFSGSRNGKSHVYAYDKKTFSYTAADFTGANKLTRDVNGTIFYGGVTNVWRWQLYLDATRFLQIVIRTEDEGPEGGFNVSGDFFTPGTVVSMGWGVTTYYKDGQDLHPSAGRITVSKYDSENVSADFKGVLSGNCSDAISEINEARTIPFEINLDVEGLAFSM